MSSSDNHTHGWSLVVTRGRRRLELVVLLTCNPHRIVGYSRFLVINSIILEFAYRWHWAPGEADDGSTVMES